MNFTKPFSDINKNSAPTAGGKGASLGEMLNAGIPVPDGYVVLADTFEHFIKETDLIQEIEAILATVDTKTIHTVDQASESIQTLIKQAQMPQNIQEEIIASFDTLNTQFVAVRSSATAEDGADHAWAGQLESYLNITKDELLEKVQHCWSSLFTPRAIFYRFEKGLHTTHISVAVVVQKMVNSEISGIAFSVHPVTEDRNQIIIEAGFGLGEAIVSGSVTPDSYVISKEPRAIIDINVNSQNKALYRDPNGGNIWKDLSSTDANAQVLSKEQILELATIIVRIENHYGFPCDIEWAYACPELVEGRGEFFIVQSRPITTLSLTNDQEKLKEKWKVVAGDFNTPFIKSFCTALGYAGHKKEHDFIMLLGCVGKNADLDYITMMSTWDSAHTIMKQRVTDDPEYLNIILNTIEDAGKKMNEWTESNFIKANLKEYSNNKLVSLIEEFIQKQSFLYTKGTVFSILDYGKYRFVEGSLNKVFTLKLENQSERDEAFEVFTTPTIDSFQLQHERELKEILISYFNQYGFKNDILNNNIDYIKRTYPDFWKNLIQHTSKYNWLFYSYMGPAYTEEDFLNIARDMLSMDSNLIEEIEKEKENHIRILAKRKEKIEKINPTPFESLILNIAEKMVWAKPRRKDYQSKSYYHLSYLLKEIGDRLNLTLDEVFFCTIEMLQEGLKSNSVDKKMIESIRKLHVIIPTENGAVELYTGLEAENFCKDSIEQENKVQNTGELKGTIAYKGIAKGFVKIINKPSEMEKMSEGDILVSLVTTPDIVPAMKKAVAIITDKGGLTCHAAIVARELKVPCIVGTEHATQLLKDGDFVEVDANKGTVTILTTLTEDSSTEDVAVHTWTKILTRKNSVFMDSMKLYASANILNNLDYDYRLKNYKIVNGDNYVAEDYGSLVESLKKHLAVKPDFLFEIIKKAHNDIANYKIVWQRIQKSDTESLSDKELTKLFEEYLQTLHGLMAYLFLPLSAEKILTEKMQSILKSHVPEDQVPTLLQRIAIPARRSLILEEQVEFLTLVDKQDGKSFDKAIFEEHVSKWAWLGDHFFWGTFWTLEDLIPRFNEYVQKDCTQEIKQIDEVENIQKADAEAVCKDLKLSKEDTRVIHLAQEYVHFRTYRLDMLFYSQFLVKNMLDEIATRLSLTYEDLVLLTPQEVINSLNKSIEFKDVIDQRKKNYAIIIKDYVVHVYSGDEVTQFHEYTKVDSKSVEGTVAYPGNVRGKVRVVLTKSDFNKLQEGDILVTHMTTPDFVPLMKKCAAIITDEGGITCHAAIVARELNKPCVIGTQYATQILKDGDLVEMDADRGVIRIL